MNTVYRERASSARCPGIARLTTWVNAAAKAVGVSEPIALTIRFVDADEGKTLNFQYRGRDYATNVLSFVAEQQDLPADLQVEILESPVEPRYIGDLVICAPVVEGEAADQGKTLVAHYAHMTVHGVLHLLGYDHEDSAEAEEMEALEVRILAGLGVKNPY